MRGSSAEARLGVDLDHLREVRGAAGRVVGGAERARDDDARVRDALREGGGRRRRGGARRRARSLQHARTIPKPSSRRRSRVPPVPPPAAVAHRHANKNTRRFDGVAHGHQRVVRGDASPLAGAPRVSARVRRRGRRPRAHPRPEPSASAPLCGVVARDVAPFGLAATIFTIALPERFRLEKFGKPFQKALRAGVAEPRVRRGGGGGGDVRAAGGPAGAPARGGRGGAATGVAVRR